MQQLYDSGIADFSGRWKTIYAAIAKSCEEKLLAYLFGDNDKIEIEAEKFAEACISIVTEVAESKIVKTAHRKKETCAIVYMTYVLRKYLPTFRKGEDTDNNIEKEILP